MPTNTTYDEPKSSKKSGGKGDYKWDFSGPTPVLVGTPPDKWEWENEDLTPLERVEAELKWTKDLIDEYNKNQEELIKNPKPVVVLHVYPTFAELSARLSALAQEKLVIQQDMKAHDQNVKIAKKKAAEEKAEK